MLLDPEIVKQVLIKNFKNFAKNDFADLIDKNSDPLFSRNPFMLYGEEWKEKRGEITPALTMNRVCNKIKFYIR
jgi:cytochrome P450